MTAAAEDVTVLPDLAPFEVQLGAQLAVVLSSTAQVGRLIRAGEWVHAHDALRRCRAATEVLDRMLEEVRHKPLEAAQVRADAVVDAARRICANEPIIDAAFQEPR